MTSSRTSSYELMVDGIAIQVTRKAVHNVNIRIHDDGTVLMSVPWRVSRRQAEAVAAGRMEWIREMRQRALARAAATHHVWMTGETLEVWGMPRRIVVSTGSREGARLDGDLLALTVLPSHEGADKASVGVRESLVNGLLTRETQAALTEMLPRVEAEVGRTATSVTVRLMKTRWGSCTTSKGTIRINSALAEHPRACLEMVLTHELCHLIEPNHGPRFHALMDRHCPGWRELQRHLDQHPPRS